MAILTHESIVCSMKVKSFRCPDAGRTLQTHSSRECILLSGEPGPQRSQVSLILHIPALPLDFFFSHNGFSNMWQKHKKPLLFREVLHALRHLFLCFGSISSPVVKHSGESCDDRSSRYLCKNRELSLAHVCLQFNKQPSSAPNFPLKDLIPAENICSIVQCQSFQLDISLTIVRLFLPSSMEGGDSIICDLN